MSSDNEETELPHVSPFESIRQESEEGIEFWSARDLAKILGYALWQKFRNVIEKAETALRSFRIMAIRVFMEVSRQRIFTLARVCKRIKRYLILWEVMNWLLTYSVLARRSRS